MNRKARREYLTASTELLLAEAEQDTREALLAADRTVPGATRDLFPHEIRAGVLFAELDRDTEQAAAVLARLWTQLRGHTLTQLEAYLAGLPDRGAALLQALADLADPTHPAVLAEGFQHGQVTRQMAEVLAGVYARGAGGVVAEADRQGVARWPLPEPSLPALEQFAAVARALAGNAAAHAVQGALNAARGPGSTRAGVLAAAADYSGTAGDDLARQAANTALGVGRGEAVEAGPTPERVYASELRDRNTCVPCYHVDGREYTSMAAALGDYPQAGAYRNCEGGSRCRGTLIFVWDETPARA